MTFADNIIAFNKQLDFKGSLPDGIRIMNPFKESAYAVSLMETFYGKYYNDVNKRHIILGINPGRFGGGVTGIPFTDSKRLKAVCHIDYEGKETHEPSSVFIYDMIDAFGGPENFYGHFYINSICPLGFTAEGKNGKEINYNYYDSRNWGQLSMILLSKISKNKRILGMKRIGAFVSEPARTINSCKN